MKFPNYLVCLMLCVLFIIGCCGCGDFTVNDKEPELYRDSFDYAVSKANDAKDSAYVYMALRKMDSSLYYIGMHTAYLQVIHQLYNHHYNEQKK